MKNRCVKIIVHGSVQGVGFRWFVEKQAKARGLKGFVKNLTNGNVCTEVEGHEGMIFDFIKILKIGNSYSRVTVVEIDWKDCEDKYNSFSIRF